MDEKVVKIIKKDKVKGVVKEKRDKNVIYVFTYDSYDNVTGDISKATAEVNITELRHEKKVLRDKISNINKILTSVNEVL